MDPQETLKNIKAHADLITSEEPVRMQTLIDMEEALYALRRWIDKGGFIPEGLEDNR